MDGCTPKALAMMDCIRGARFRAAPASACSDMPFFFANTVRFVPLFSNPDFTSAQCQSGVISISRPFTMPLY